MDHVNHKLTVAPFLSVLLYILNIFVKNCSWILNQFFPYFRFLMYVWISPSSFILPAQAFSLVWSRCLCSAPQLPLGVARPSANSLLRLSAILPVSSISPNVEHAFLYRLLRRLSEFFLQWSASRNITPWRPSKPLTTRFVQKPWKMWYSSTLCYLTGSCSG